MPSGDEPSPRHFALRDSSAGRVAADHHFIDECTIAIRAGDGGDGCASFRREPNNPRGGPSGGDGGNGGSVILVADPQLSTLYDVHYQRQYTAPNGERGQGRDRYGHSGADGIVRVPVGTVVRDRDDVDPAHVLCDLSQAGQRYIAARGGTGGWGNIHFATSTNQAPHRADPGEPGQSCTLRLELKLLADVGLLGYPNVGKSSLIARVSRARPKIANYPFTTLLPNLGVVTLPLDAARHGQRTGGKGPGDRSFVLADVPGLIEGAHLGHGLGHQFLRHLSRAPVLIHLLEVPLDLGAESPRESRRDPLRDFDILNEELRLYDPDLARRPQLVALSKMDLSETRAHYPALLAAFADRGIKLYGISAATGEGLGALLDEAYRQSQKQSQPLTPEPGALPGPLAEPPTAR